jgi:pantoate--beta-alanine ligase
MSQIVITTVAEMESVRDRLTGSVGLVPTMGYLHEGHLSLVRRALKENDQVIVSIFVNPTQFGPNEDLARYPRDLDRDLSLLGSAHSSTGTRHSALAFVPSVEEIYPPGFDDWTEVTGLLTERLEGAQRPGHFRGVTTVVARLFRIIRPHHAYFGQKDAQQLRVIRCMVEERDLNVEIVPMPTVREPDGLAMSSRNVYLSPEERDAALALPRALALSRRMVMDEGVTDAEGVRHAVRETVETPRRGVSTPSLALDYASVSDERSLEELKIIDRPALVLLATRVGATRLIDNTIVIPKGIPVPARLSELVDADNRALPSPPPDVTYRSSSR